MDLMGIWGYEGYVGLRITCRGMRDCGDMRDCGIAGYAGLRDMRDMRDCGICGIAGLRDCGICGTDHLPEIGPAVLPFFGPPPPSLYKS